MEKLPVQPCETRRKIFWGESVNQNLYGIPIDRNIMEQDNKIRQV